jgi:hypothetical protein
MKRVQFKWIPIILAFAFVPVQSPAQEPLRAGVDVPEPAVVKRVEIEYPFPAPEQAMVVLGVMINEQGAVADITVGQYNSAIVEAAKSSVWKWRFAPTVVNGKAVPITATVAILFSMGRTLPTVDLGADFLMLMPLGNRATMCTFPVRMDHEGNLKEEPDSPFITMQDLNGIREVNSRKQFCGKPMYYSLSPESDAPFSRIEETLKMRASSAAYILQSPRYYFPFSASIKYARPGIERLYYSVLLVSNGSQLIQLAGVDSDVQPPKIDVDFGNIAKSLRDPRYEKGAVYLFKVLIDENGSILGIEPGDTTNEVILESLSTASVITPGTRKGKPVPTAVVVAIPVK